jgi:hypothetical protein
MIAAAPGRLVYVLRGRPGPPGGRRRCGRRTGSQWSDDDEGLTSESIARAPIHRQALGGLCGAFHVLSIQCVLR